MLWRPKEPPELIRSRTKRTMAHRMGVKTHCTLIMRYLSTRRELQEGSTVIFGDVTLTTQ